MSKLIFAYGFQLPKVDGFEPISLASERSMVDADIIVVEPSFNDFSASETYQGLSLMGEHSSARFRETQIRWKGQISAALRSGKTVVVFLTKIENRFYYTGEKKNVGTAGRPRMQTIVHPCSNYDFVPTGLAEMSVAEGSGFKLTGYGAELLDQYWREFENISTYRCYFKAVPDQVTLITTKGGEHAVAALVRSGEGRLVLLPELTWDHLNEFWPNEEPEEEDEDFWPAEYEQFSLRLRDMLIALDKGLRSSGERSAAPEWAAASVYRLESESKLEIEMLELTERIENLRGQYAEVSTQLESEGELRALLFETGPRLEAAVRQALQIIGFEVQHFEDGQSEFDAIFISSEGRFIGEVEGRDNKAIDVKKASQLHRNITEDFARDEVEAMATGVLFGNAYRLSPPEERADSFTAKVVTFAGTVGMVLARTSDVFAVARHVKNSGDLEFARRCREAIANAKGTIVVFPTLPLGSVPDVYEAP